MKRNLLFIIIQVMFFASSCNSGRENEKIDKIIEDIYNGEVYKDRSFEDLLLISTNVYYESKEVGYKKGMLAALDKISEFHVMRGDSKRCLISANEGIALAKELGDKIHYASLLCLKGYVMLDQGYTDAGKKLLKESLAMTETIKDSNIRHLKRIQVYTTMLEVFDGRFTEGDLDLDSISRYHQFVYDETQLVTSSSPLYSRAMITGHYVLALKYIDSIFGRDRGVFLEKAKVEVDKGIDLSRQKSYQDYLAMGLITKSFILGEQKEFREALDLSLQAEPIFRHYGFKYELKTVLILISDLYNRLGDFKKEAHYLGLSNLMADSLHLAEVNAIRETAIKGHVEPAPRLIYYLSFAGFIVLLILLSLFYARKKKRAENIASMVNDSITNESINPLPDKNIDTGKLREVIELAKEDNKLFYMSFLELYPNFKEKLKDINPQMTTSDAEFCALLKLNFDTKTIARYRNISVRSVESKKYRIRKKLGLAKDYDIYSFFINF